MGTTDSIADLYISIELEKWKEMGLIVPVSQGSVDALIRVLEPADHSGRMRLVRALAAWGHCYRALALTRKEYCTATVEKVALTERFFKDISPSLGGVVDEAMHRPLSGLRRSLSTFSVGSTLVRVPGTTTYRQLREALCQRHGSKDAEGASRSNA